MNLINSGYKWLRKWLYKIRSLMCHRFSINHRIHLHPFYILVNKLVKLNKIISKSDLSLRKLNLIFQKFQKKLNLKYYLKVQQRMPSRLNRLSRNLNWKLRRLERHLSSHKILERKLKIQIKIP